ncbi:unnamed protein product [Ilex paraguariensis]|uniref:Exocyst subunit Exo70 family protein n=1 Tax=Ilex paraguariensis TaxID=185542 RepID=A0ABC8T5N4_9AQUA
MYTAIANHWPEIESIFSFESTFDIRSQALTSLVKLCESVRTSLIEFKSAIRKNSSKSPVDGAGIHALTTDVMHYLCLLGDYNNILADILADLPLPAKYSSPESYLDTLSVCVVPDSKLRDEIKVSIARKLVGGVSRVL